VRPSRSPVRYCLSKWDPTKKKRGGGCYDLNHGYQNPGQVSGYLLLLNKTQEREMVVTEKVQHLIEQHHLYNIFSQHWSHTVAYFQLKI
jgi:hypothetical protein